MGAYVPFTSMEFRLSTAGNECLWLYQRYLFMLENVFKKGCCLKISSMVLGHCMVLLPLCIITTVPKMSRIWHCRSMSGQPNELSNYYLSANQLTNRVNKINAARQSELCVCVKPSAARPSDHSMRSWSTWQKLYSWRYSFPDSFSSVRMDTLSFRRISCSQF